MLSVLWWEMVKGFGFGALVLGVIPLAFCLSSYPAALPHPYLPFIIYSSSSTPFLGHLHLLCLAFSIFNHCYCLEAPTSLSLRTDIPSAP